MAGIRQQSGAIGSSSKDSSCTEGGVHTCPELAAARAQIHLANAPEDERLRADCLAVMEEAMRFFFHRAVKERRHGAVATWCKRNVRALKRNLAQVTMAVRPFFRPVCASYEEYSALLSHTAAGGSKQFQRRRPHRRTPISCECRSEPVASTL
jgi:hypothetical protein